MSLRGHEIPTKWRGNEIPTNHPLELYIIYNPAIGTSYGLSITKPEKESHKTTFHGRYLYWKMAFDKKLMLMRDTV